MGLTNSEESVNDRCQLQDNYSLHAADKTYPAPLPVLTPHKMAYDTLKSCQVQCLADYNKYVAAGAWSVGEHGSAGDRFSKNTHNWRCIPMEQAPIPGDYDKNMVKKGYSAYCDIYEIDSRQKTETGQPVRK